MGTFSIWHWLIVGLFVAALVWVIRAARRAAQNAPAGPGGLKPYGTSGWLALFLVGATVIGPLYLARQTANAIGSAEAANPALRSLDGWSEYKTFSWVLVLAVVAWNWRMAFGLSNHHVPASATRVKYTLLALPLVTSVADAMAAKFFLDVNVAEASVVDYIRAAFQSGVWFLYFVFSKRVRNTYYGGRKDISWSYSTSPVTGVAAPVKPMASPVQTPPPAPVFAPQRPAPVQPTPALSASPDPSPARAKASLEERLSQLRDLHSKGLISADDFERKKSELLQQL